MKTENRPLDGNESSRLSESIRQLGKTANPKLNWTTILILALLTVLSAIHIYYYDKSNFSLISKFLVCLFPVVIWTKVENEYKGSKKRTEYLSGLKEIERNKTINVVEIYASRIIEFIENKDEGTLYLIELILKRGGSRATWKLKKRNLTRF